MSCPTCNNSNGPIIVGGLRSILPLVNAPCNSSGCPTPQDAKCTFYTGGNLTCSGINSNDSLEVALQKIDSLLCASAANYSTYNTFCLAPITTQQQFVESISQRYCALNDSYTNFTTSTFPNYQTSVTNAIGLIGTPGTTSACSNISIPVNSTIQTILQTFSNAFGDIYCTRLNLSTINWAQCFAVSPTPITLQDAFGVVLNQICAVAASSGAVLPTFNNTGSCLPTPGATDSLVDTVNKIKTRLCQSPIFDINALTWACISKPSNATTDLQSAFAALMAQVDTLSRNNPTFSGDFAVTATNPSNTCGGKTISLSSSIADRKVAATSTDNTPSTLDQKLVGDGTTIEVDYTSTTQGIVKLIGGGGGASDGKVKTDVADISDYLGVKIVTGNANNGVQVIPSLDTTNPDHQIKLNASVDPIELFTALLNEVVNDAGLKALFCSVVAGCPSPCAAPTNVTIVYGGLTTSSTTTTTTTVLTTTTTTTTLAPTTTTTTTTSSTTTTTTTLATIFVGAQSSSTPPNSAAVVSGGTTSSQYPFNDVIADWTPFNATPQFCWVAIPNEGGTSIKTKWFVDILNNGNIGGGINTFGDPIPLTIAGKSYDLYFTNFATTFTAVCEMQA